MLSVVMLSVIMLSVIMLSIIILSVVMLGVFIVAPGAEWSLLLGSNPSVDFPGVARKY
jgi:hypothetical protein